MSICIGWFHSWGKWGEPQEGFETRLNYQTGEQKKYPAWIQIRRCQRCNAQEVREAR